jgi:hypothetical protein
MRATHVLISMLCAAIFAPQAARAQAPGDTVVVAAGAQYEAAPLTRLLNGPNWRTAWTQPLRVPVLDLRRFAGGLTPERQGGGNQSITLHMRDGQGRRWIFRSIDKYPGRALPSELRDTPAGDIIQDHISALHPGGHFLMPPLLEAVGVLHVVPQLFMMPDDAALGEFRETFAGMLGEIEERPNEGPDNTPGWGGFRAIKGSEEFLDDLEDSQQHRLDEREFLRARLVDFLVGDPDRGTDQWRWARSGEEGAYTWRPIPMDRDWALVRADGSLARLARDFYPKISKFGDGYASIETLTFSSHILDRRLLTRLSRLDVATEAERVRAAITDAVIARAVAALPPAYAALHGAEIAQTLRARRDGLPRIAAEFYAWLASDVDVRGTDEADHVEVERHEGGSVLVRISPRRAAVADAGEVGTPNGRPSANAPRPYYERLFRPDETREIRIYLHGGDDHAVISGERGGPIVVRVIGGGGDDTLEDRAGGARFYDDRGDNTIVRAAGTRFSDARWDAPPAPEGVRANLDWAPDWGGSRSFGPALGYDDRAGVLFGVRADAKRYGFRRLPYRWDLGARVLYAPANGGARGEIEFDYRLANPSLSAAVEAHASSLDSFRFYGFGNETPDLESASARVDYQDVRIAPSLRIHFGRRAAAGDDADPGEAGAGDDEPAPAGERWSPRRELRTVGVLSFGPVFGWIDPRIPAGANVIDAVAAEAAVTELGVRAVVQLERTDGTAVPRRGFRLRAEGAAYPFVGGPADAFGTLGAAGSLYIPLVGSGSHLALRAGAEHALGEFPLFHAAFVGGRRTLRGTRTDRYAGDAAVHGAAELRVPVDSITLLLRSELGVFAFTDAARVWHEGASPGGWHSGYGGGVWLSAFGRALSVALARGESTRVHAWFGLPF